MTGIKISIITPTYNCKEDLQNTLNSVHSQINTDWEHIIIDGNSVDGTLEVIRQNKAKISYWVSEKDQGVYDAMNKGLKAAKGEYVLFLNAGDTLFSKNTLDKIPFCKYPNADIFYGETVILNNQRERVGLRQKKLPHSLAWRHLRKGMVVCHQSIIVRRGLAPNYDTQYTIAADIDWIIRALQKSSQTIFTGTIISNFIEGGLSTKYRARSWKERWNIIKKHFGLLTCIVSHIVFIFDQLLLKMKLKPTYREIDSKFLSNE